MNVVSTAVQATEMCCKSQRRVVVSHSSWNIIYRMCYERGRGWHQITWLDRTFSIDPWTRHLIRRCWRRRSNRASYRWFTRLGTRRIRVLSPFLSLSARRCERTFYKPLGLAVANRQLFYHSCSPVLYTPDNSWWAVWREEWLHVGTPPTKSCGKHLLRHFYANAPTCVKEDNEAHPLVWPSSRGTYGSAGHVTKKCAGYPIVLHIVWCTVTARPSCT
jgi:hypothetical protein